jgi:osmoprotectant transport system permease protein
VAPNRLLPGQGLSLWVALGPWAFLLLIPIAGAMMASRRAMPGVALALVLTAMIGLCIGAGTAAGILLQGRPPAARATLGAGFWTALALLGLLALEEIRASGLRWAGPLAALGLVAVLAVATASGIFDRVSLVVEWRARSGTITAALVQHLVLAGAALGLALAVAVPLGLLAVRFPRTEGGIGAALNAFQVVPAIALFGLLIPVLGSLLAWAPALRRMGLGAIGPTPALIGVAIYVALPLTRGVVSGLRSADPAAVEAARAMGMRKWQIATGIRLPLGLPVLAGALRVATVQSIGFMTLGGLIGAGGLGAIVFEGMSQLAADLILLGALPVIALALLADALLATLETRFQRWRS